MDIDGLKVSCKLQWKRNMKSKKKCGLCRWNFKTYILWSMTNETIFIQISKSKTGEHDQIQSCLELKALPQQGQGRLQTAAKTRQYSTNSAQVTSGQRLAQYLLHHGIPNWDLVSLAWELWTGRSNSGLTLAIPTEVRVE